MPLPLADVATVFVDDSGGRIYYSSGPAGDTVLVTDLAGTYVDQLTGLAGPTGLVPGLDGSAWVATARGHETVQYDAKTLAFRRSISLPADQCPDDLRSTTATSSTATPALATRAGAARAGSGSSSTPSRNRRSSPRRRGRLCEPLSASSQEFGTRAAAAESGDPGPTAGPTASVFDLQGGNPAVLVTVPIGRGLKDVGVRHWYPLLVTATT